MGGHVSVKSTLGQGSTFSIIVSCKIQMLKNKKHNR